MSFRSFWKNLFGGSASQTTVREITNSAACVCMQHSDGKWYCFKQNGENLIKCPNSGQYNSEEECEAAHHGQC